ncbi:MAG: AMIN domain-containing protein, partial [Candidatus Competibacterales bacterium]|nr:AMIN domain-containing protein [Candidatus Competibacterales bacterium]
MLLGLLVGPVQAQQQPVLEAVDIGELPGNQVQLRFRLSEPIPEPNTFTVNEPARIVLDFMGVRSELSTSQQRIGRGLAEQVTVLEGDDRTRAAISLTRLVPYSLSSQGRNVLLTLAASGTAGDGSATSGGGSPGT